VFNGLQEVKDYRAKSDARGAQLKGEFEARKLKLDDLQKARNGFRIGSDDWDRANQEFVRAVIEAQAAQTVTQAELVRTQKMQTKQVFDKVLKAVANIAEQQGITLVLAESLPPEPSDEEFEKLTPEQLAGLLSQRNLLYVAPSLDITNDVIIKMDADYKSGN
jgi:Skp family chaperone for outer membrane proteins